MLFKPETVKLLNDVPAAVSTVPTRAEGSFLAAIVKSCFAPPLTRKLKIEPAGEGIKVNEPVVGGVSSEPASTVTVTLFPVSP